MHKPLLALTIVMVLTGCGGSSNSEAPVVQNSAAVFSSNVTGSITAAGGSISGNLTITDADAGEASAVSQTEVATTYGSFSISAAGQWTYSVNAANSDLVALELNDSAVDTIPVTSVDGTRQNISITVEGVNDLAEFGVGDGVDSAAINNDLTTPITGILTVSDVDTGEDAFIAQAAAMSTYGEFSIDETGAWTYILNTSNATVLALVDESDSVSDSLTVSSIDGTLATITVTISGVAQQDVSTLTKGFIGDNDSVPEINCSTTVNSTSDLEDAVSFDMTPGETVCLAAGTYADLELKFGGVGTDALPITVAAALPGEVIINGDASIGMTGEYVVFQGFVFKDGNMDSSLLQTRANSNTACNNCRITENTFVNMDAGQDNSTKWFQIYGSGNRFDHNWVSGKQTRGALFIVERGEQGTEDRTQIDHNYFADRPPIGGVAYADNSDNEYEGIRIGSSSTHTSDSFAVIEHNYFERIDGEAEVISVKAGGVTVAHNTVRISRGSIVSRHGEGTTIDNNYIIGDGNPFSGGVRIVDANHSVTNNYIQGARNASSNFYGGILISASDGSTSNGYQDVENVLVANNTIVDSINSINLFAGNEDNKPESIYFANNVVADAIGYVFKNVDQMPNNSVFSSNYIYGQSLADNDDISSVTGFTFADPMLSADGNGVYRPTANSADLFADLSAFTGDFLLPSKDMDGQARTDSTLAGADEVSTEALAATDMRGLLTPDLVGPLSYTPPVGTPFIQQVAIINDDFDNQTTSGWTSIGAEITTDIEAVFSRGSSVKLDSATDSLSQIVTVEANTNYTLSAFVKGAGKLSATLGSQVYTADENSSDYRFTSVSFNSASETSVTISATIDDTVLGFVNIENSNFDDDQDGWVINEGTGIGQVQDSDNSASGANGSIKFKHNDDDNGTPYQPYIAQTITVQANSEYTLTMYNLLKSSDAQDSTVLFGAHTGDAIDGGVFSNDTVIASKNSIYADLNENDEGDDSFRPDTLIFNSGDNTTITIFAQYQSVSGDDIRIDDFSLSAEGPPPADTETFFHSFRLVSHPSL